MCVCVRVGVRVGVWVGVTGIFVCSSIGILPCELRLKGAVLKVMLHMYCMNQVPLVLCQRNLFGGHLLLYICSPFYLDIDNHLI